jgi:anthranilate synthase component 1
MRPLKADLNGNDGPEKILPVFRTVPIGGLSPDVAWLKLCSSERYSFLLESREGEEKVARYSFLGWDPFVIFRSKGSHVEIYRDGHQITLEGDPVTALKNILRGFSHPAQKELPRFSGGAVGYFGYDTVRFFEHLPDENPDDLGLPDSCFIFPRMVLVFDHQSGFLTVIAHVVEGRGEGREQAHGDIDRVIERLARTGYEPKDIVVRARGPLKIESNLTEEEFENMVERAKRYIRAGDIFQVVLSQRLKVDIKTDPFRVFRALGATNPSPYMFYLHFDQLKVVGSSPEALVRVTSGRVETRPLAGTRPRGKTARQDRELIRDLLADEKERAEHIMLVDLGRNDLGRVCRYGSVRVTELLGIEKYSHVIHLVSNVVGDLRDDRDEFDVLRAAFPAGTVSGAPKVRAMEIIEELEPTRRGIYAGAVGYVDLGGNLDTCIAIRTVVVKNGTAYIQAGAGIVADSVPKREYRETMAKARALMVAVERAGREGR